MQAAPRSPAVAETDRNYIGVDLGFSSDIIENDFAGNLLVEILTKL
jgi:hypothetical protein